MIDTEFDVLDADIISDKRSSVSLDRYWANRVIVRSLRYRCSLLCIWRSIWMYLSRHISRHCCRHAGCSLTLLPPSRDVQLKYSTWERIPAPPSLRDPSSRGHQARYASADARAWVKLID